MGLKEIKENLLQAAELVGDFEANGMEIDRDVALDKIRAAYESLRFLYEEAAHETINKVDEDSEEIEEDEEPEIEFEFVLPEQEDVEPEEEIVEEELLEEEVVEEELAEEEVIEEELAEEDVAEEAVEEVVEEEFAEETVTEEVVTEEIAEESVTEEVEEPVTEGVEAEETAVEEAEEVVTEEPKRVVAEPSLFGDDSLWGKASAPTQTLSKIMALYDDEEVAQPEPVAVPVVEPAVEVEEEERSPRARRQASRGVVAKKPKSENESTVVEEVKNINDAASYFMEKGVTVESKEQLEELMQKYNVVFPNMK